MYTEHFHLREAPFKITPDSDFLYMSAAHARAKAYMDYSIRNRDGFVVITGEVGAGKTTLIRKLLSEFDDDVVVAKVFQTQLTETEFLQAVLVEFGLNPFRSGKVEMMDMLSTFLVDSFVAHKRLVLIVDEAQNLDRRVLEEIRMLSGLETAKQKILHVILVGQPELNATLDSPDLEQLTQRVRLRFHIAALSEEEVRDYIHHRLRVAGARNPDDLFSGDTMEIIHAYSGGIPRLINTLCDTALTCAFADDRKTVGADEMRAAIEELQWVPYAARHRDRQPANRLDACAGTCPPGSDFPWVQSRLESIEGLLREMTVILQKRHHISLRVSEHHVAQILKTITHEADRLQADGKR